MVSSREGRGHATEAYEQGLLFIISGPQLVTGNPRQGEGCACQVFESSSSCPRVPYRSRNPPRLPGALSAVQKEKIFFGPNVALRLMTHSKGEDFCLRNSKWCSSFKNKPSKSGNSMNPNKSWLIKHGSLIRGNQTICWKILFQKNAWWPEKCVLHMSKWISRLLYQSSSYLGWNVQGHLTISRDILSLYPWMCYQPAGARQVPMGILQRSGSPHSKQLFSPNANDTKVEKSTTQHTTYDSYFCCVKMLNMIKTMFSFWVKEKVKDFGSSVVSSLFKQKLCITLRSVKKWNKVTLWQHK